MTRPGRHDRAILHLSRGGGDACVLREYDLSTRRFVPDGFALPEAKGGAAWLDDDTLLFELRLGRGNGDASGYARTVRRWPRGTDPAIAPEIFAIDAAHMSAGVEVDQEDAWAGLLHRPHRLLRHGGAYRRPRRPSAARGPAARCRVHLAAGLAGGTAAQPRWTVAGVIHAPDTLLGADLGATLAGKAHYQVLFTPAERRALQAFFWCDERLVVSVLEDLSPVFRS